MMHLWIPISRTLDIQWNINQYISFIFKKEVSFLFRVSFTVEYRHTPPKKGHFSFYFIL